MNDLLAWIHSNLSAAFWMGVGLLVALGMLLAFVDKIVRYILQAHVGVPPEVVVECPYRCDRKHIDDDEE